MSKLNVEKQKAIVRKINEISDLMGDICELYEGLQYECDESGHDGYAEVEKWFSNDFPSGISESFDELPWEFATWAEELEELVLDENYEERKKANAEAMARMF